MIGSGCDLIKVAAYSDNFLEKLSKSEQNVLGQPVPVRDHNSGPLRYERNRKAIISYTNFVSYQHVRFTVYDG